MRPAAEILTIGNELLKGSTLNTNAQFLGGELTSLGFEVIGQTACRDHQAEIVNALGGALKRAQLVILSGGLGPTPDDLTRDALAAYFRVPLKISPRQLRFIQNYYRSRRRRMPEMVKKEAMFPANAAPLFNRFGIALGFSITYGSRLIVVLPGVPFELQNMFQKLVVPVLKKHFRGIGQYEKLIVKTVGLSEPTVMLKLGKDFFSDPFEFGIYPEAGEATLRLYADSKSIIQRLRKKVERRLSGAVYAYEEITLPAAVGQLLKQKKKTLAAAESCTGGLLASLLTQVPGASRYFRGSVTAYQPEIKKWLGVSPAILKKQGAVSAKTAQELAIQVRKHLGSDFGLAITGVAGPEREEGKPVGLVFIGLADAKRSYVWEEKFLGERTQIQLRAAKRALEYLWETLKGY